MEAWGNHMAKLSENFAVNWPGHCADAFNALGWACNDNGGVRALSDNRNNYLTMANVSTYYGTGNGDGFAITPDHTTNSFNGIYPSAGGPVQFPLIDSSVSPPGTIIRMTMNAHDNTPTFDSYTLPTGLSLGVNYYVVNLTGTAPNYNFKLSLRPGGTPVMFSDNGKPNTGQSFFEWGCVPSSCPAVLADLNPNNPTSEAFGCVSTMSACGFRVPNAYRQLKTLMDNNLRNIVTTPTTIGFPSNPVWAMVGTF
jgi:hypothetical protein